MSNDQERSEIAKAYKRSPRWMERVKKMSDAQVHAIYIRLKNQGRI